MGLLDDAKDKANEAAAKIDERTDGKLTEATEKATEMAGKAKDAAEKAVGTLDEKTGGKVTEMTEKAKEKLPTDKIPGMEHKDTGTGRSDSEESGPSGPGA